MCGTKVTRWSQVRPKNFASEHTGIESWYNVKIGSRHPVLLLQKWTQQVFAVEKVNPFLVPHCISILMHSCSCLSANSVEDAPHHRAKSSTNSDFPTPGGRESAISLIASAKSMTLRMLPWGTPFSWRKRADMEVPTLTRKYLSFKKFLITHPRLPLTPA